MTNITKTDRQLKEVETILGRKLYKGELMMFNLFKDEMDYQPYSNNGGLAYRKASIS